MHPLASSSAGTFIPILGKIQSPQHRPSIPRPLDPATSSNGVVYAALHHHSPRILLPGPPKKRKIRALHRGEFGARRYSALVDGEAGVLARVGSAVGQDGVVAGVAVGAAEDEAAALEDRGSVSKDEVDCAIDITFSVELAEDVGVEGVLVACYTASVKDGAVGGYV